MSSPIRDIDAARQALAMGGKLFQRAIGAAFFWYDTPQGCDFWLDECAAGRLSGEGRAALTAMVAEYEAEHSEEVPAPAPDPVFAETLAALKDARECVEAWAAYASEYFREKHDLAGDLARIDAAIRKAEGRS